MWYAGLPLLVGCAIFATFSVIAACQFVSRFPSLDWRQRAQALITGIAISLFFLGILNFALFWTIGIAIGGTADKVENGRFFIKSNGRHTEVPEEVWTYSYYHTHSIWVTHPLGMLSIA